ncbi:MAG: PaaI family thioesterase [Gordonia sp. (in: high G+C Gram-positive bacteria)]
MVTPRLDPTTMSGLDLLRAWAQTPDDHPGIGRLLGMRPSRLELKINYIRAVQVDAGELTGIGTVIHVGGRTATADGKVLSADGKLVAHGSTTCMVFR